MANYTALYDANVLYPAPMRDILLELAVADLFRAKWSADIHREWIEALLRNDPQRVRAKLERTRDLMDASTRDCLVTGYETLIPSLQLPDAKDRHVLAAAIVGRCDVIVTQNIKDFPEDVLAGYGIDVQHPDEFLCNHFQSGSRRVPDGRAEGEGAAEEAALHGEGIPCDADAAGAGGHGGGAGAVFRADLIVSEN